MDVGTSLSHNINYDQSYNKICNILETGGDGVFEKIEEIVSTLNINHEDEDGMTLLARACNDGKVELVKLLVKYDVNVNYANKLGRTALFYSCPTANIIASTKIIKILLGVGSNINHVDKGGDTPLTIACYNSHINGFVVKLLIERGSNVNHITKSGATALLIACGDQDIRLI